MKKNVDSLRICTLMKSLNQTLRLYEQDHGKIYKSTVNRIIQTNNIFNFLLFII